MKREAFDHPKIKLLARDLRLPMFAARGLVDSIWLITGMNFPQGEIRWSAEELAIALDYPDDADAMVAALVKRNLLEPTDEGWYVHDWHEHADDATNMKLARNGLKFANGSLPNLHRLSKEQRDRALKKYEEGTNGAQVGDNEPAVRTNEEGVRTEAHKGALPEPVPEPVPEFKEERELARADSYDEETGPLAAQDGMSYWDRDSTSEPMRTVAKCLCRAASALEQGPPSEDVVRKGSRDGSDCRKLIELIGWEEAADLHAWAVRHGKADTFKPLLNNLTAYQFQRKKGTEWVPKSSPPLPVRGTETVAEKIERRQEAARKAHAA